MTHVSSLSDVLAGRHEPIARRSIERAPDKGAANGHVRGPDLVDLSENARNAGRAEEPAVRTELVQRVRREIAAGTYETTERLDIAADRLARDLDLLA